MKKIVSTLAALILSVSLVTAIGCFIRMMFYTNIPKSTEVMFYSSLALMFLCVISILTVEGLDV